VQLHHIRDFAGNGVQSPKAGKTLEQAVKSLRPFKMMLRSRWKYVSCDQYERFEVDGFLGIVLRVCLGAKRLWAFSAQLRSV
jgi:hypothetical protein